MNARLVSLDYQVPSCDTSLRTLPVIVGRSAEVGICLNDPSVSNFHCRIELVDGQFIVSDLGSRHGTFVNGKRITESPLMPGDALGVGMLSFFLQCLPSDASSLETTQESLTFRAPRTRVTAPLVRAPG